MIQPTTLVKCQYCWALCDRRRLDIKPTCFDCKEKLKKQYRETNKEKIKQQVKQRKNNNKLYT